MCSEKDSEVELKTSYCQYCRFLRYPSEMTTVKLVRSSVQKCIYCVKRAKQHRKGRK